MAASQPPSTPLPCPGAASGSLCPATKAQCMCLRCQMQCRRAKKGTWVASRQQTAQARVAMALQMERHRLAPQLMHGTIPHLCSQWSR